MVLMKLILNFKGIQSFSLLFIILKAHMLYAKLGKIFQV